MHFWGLAKGIPAENSYQRKHKFGLIVLRYYPGVILLWLYSSADTRWIPSIQIWWHEGIRFVAVRRLSPNINHSVCRSVLSCSSHFITNSRRSIFGKLVFKKKALLHVTQKVQLGLPDVANRANNKCTAHMAIRWWAVVVLHYWPNYNQILRRNNTQRTFYVSGCFVSM